jgi:hypothetical protein
MSGELKCVCKHCGASADRIYAEVTCTGWMEVGIEVEADGKISTDTFGGVQDVDDVDVDCYRCSECRKSAYKIEDMLSVPPAAGEPGEPCGRCGHDMTDHPALDWDPKKKPYYTRGPMPCSCGGCDCHDFFSDSLGLVRVAA